MQDSRCITLLLLIILVSIMKEASALRCYTCTADNELSCNKSQISTNCPVTNRLFDPACLTVQYTMVKDEVQYQIKETTFETKCVSGEYACNFYCDYLEHVDECTATCCATSYCNKAMKEQDIYSNKKRRNNVENNGNAMVSNSSTKTMLLILEILTPLLLNSKMFS